MDKHICQEEYAHLASMKEFYKVNHMLATSEEADIALIRSHIAYHAGAQRAKQATIKPSRGHSFRVRLYGMGDDGVIARITDHYDHRNGVTGLFSVITNNS